MALSQRRRRLVLRLGQRRSREREGRVLVEGVRAVVEALDAGASGRFAVVADGLEQVAGGAALLRRLGASGLDVERVGGAELRELADTEHPQGVLLVCLQPEGTPELRQGGRYLVLDAVRDPGNVGTLIRAATAFALEGVVVLDGTADPWGTKAVRASAGTVFRVPVLVGDAESALDRLDRAGVPLLMAEAGGADTSRVRPGEGWALVVGNEATGPRPEVRSRASARVGIRMPGPAESLNAAMAGAILLFALTRESSGV